MRKFHGGDQRADMNFADMFQMVLRSLRPSVGCFVLHVSWVALLVPCVDRIQISKRVDGSENLFQNGEFSSRWRIDMRSCGRVAELETFFEVPFLLCMKYRDLSILASHEFKAGTFTSFASSFIRSKLTDKQSSPTKSISVCCYGKTWVAQGRPCGRRVPSSHIFHFHCKATLLRPLPRYIHL
jgi:hypothetical protein